MGIIGRVSYDPNGFFLNSKDFVDVCLRRNTNDVGAIQQVGMKQRCV
jgi:hypothetical protein